MNYLQESCRYLNDLTYSYVTETCEILNSYNPGELRKRISNKINDSKDLILTASIAPIVFNILENSTFLEYLTCQTIVTGGLITFITFQELKSAINQKKLFNIAEKIPLIIKKQPYL